MSKNLLERIGLRFLKKNKFKVLLGLLTNALLFCKWKLHKIIHGIHHPVVHYYGICWNEEKMLPFMFHHYDSFVSKYIIYDNGSTDSSLQMIRNHPNTEIVPFTTDGFNDEVHNNIKNQCWKASRGKADYVIVCDIDEFLYTQDMKHFFASLRAENISCPLSIGYDMCCSSFPDFKETPSLVENIKTGIYNRDYSKCIFFNPYKIVEINYEPGAHFCHPFGLVRSQEKPLYTVLHYKYLGLEYVMGRSIQYRQRMSAENIEKGYATQYMEEDEIIKKNIINKIQNARTVLE